MALIIDAARLNYWGIYFNITIILFYTLPRCVMIIIVVVYKMSAKMSEIMNYINIVTFFNFAVINWIAYALVLVDTF